MKRDSKVVITTPVVKSQSGPFLVGGDSAIKVLLVSKGDSQIAVGEGIIWPQVNSLPIFPRGVIGEELQGNTRLGRRIIPISQAVETVGELLVPVDKVGRQAH